MLSETKDYYATRCRAMPNGRRANGKSNPAIRRLRQAKRVARELLYHSIIEGGALWQNQSVHNGSKNWLPRFVSV
jgi:hypothetical protein